MKSAEEFYESEEMGWEDDLEKNLFRYTGLDMIEFAEKYANTQKSDDLITKYDLEYEQEIIHIFESGANEIRIRGLFARLLDRAERMAFKVGKSGDFQSFEEFKLSQL